MSEGGAHQFGKLLGLAGLVGVMIAIGWVYAAVIGFGTGIFLQKDIASVMRCLVEDSGPCEATMEVGRLLPYRPLYGYLAFGTAILGWLIYLGTRPGFDRVRIEPSFVGRDPAPASNAHPVAQARVFDVAGNVSGLQPGREDLPLRATAELCLAAPAQERKVQETLAPEVTLESQTKPDVGDSQAHQGLQSTQRRRSHHGGGPHR